MKKVLLMGLAILLVLTMVVGCSNPKVGTAADTSGSATEETEVLDEASKDRAETGEDESIKIGVSMATTQNLFFSKMVQIIEDRCEEIGVDVVVSDENYDLNAQISTMESFMSMECSAILLVVFDAEGISDAVQTAVDEDVFVMTYDGFVEGAQGSLNVDNYEYGYEVGEMAAEWVNSNPELKEQEVIEAGIFDYPTIPIIIDRADGIEDALAELAPNVKIVDRQEAGAGDEGVVLGENFLQAHPNIQMICGINDTGVLGAYEVWTAEGHDGETIGLFGADGDPQALNLISEDTCYRGTVMTSAYESLREAVDICVAASKGEEVDGNIVYGMTPVTKENVADFLEEAK